MFGLEPTQDVTTGELAGISTGGGVIDVFASSWTMYVSALIFMVILIASGIVLFKLVINAPKLGGDEKERALGLTLLKSNLSRVAIIIGGSIIFWALLTTWFGMTL